MSEHYKKHLAFLFIAAAMVLVAGLGLRDPWPADEPRYALIARDMAASGHWLLPYVGGVVYPDKPPLFFWVVAAFYAVTGSIRVALFLPGILAGLGTLVLVTDLGRRLWGPKTGIWCGITLLALIQFPLQMKSGQIDGFLCFWTTLGLYGLARHLLLGPDWCWYVIGGLAAGLGIITKGVGFLPYLLFIPYVAAARSGWPVLRHTWHDFRWLLAPVATLLAVSVWLVPMLIVTSGSADPDLLAYRDDILFHQTVTRYTNAWGHFRPPWYLFTNAVPWLWLPVTLLLPWLIPAWRCDIKARNPAILLLGSWVLLVLLFFSLSMGKRSLYIFPAAPALALIAGFHARALLQRKGVQRVLVALPALIGLLLAAVGAYALLTPEALAKWLTDGPTIVKTTLALFSTGTVMMAIVVVFRRRRVRRGFAAAMITFWLGVSILVPPWLNDTRSGAGLMKAVERQLTPGSELGFVDWPEQFLLHWHHPAYHFGYRRADDEEVRDAVRWLASSAVRRVLLPRFLLEPCFDPASAVEIGMAHRRTWVLVDRSALTGECSTDDKAPRVVAYIPPGD